MSLAHQHFAASSAQRFGLIRGGRRANETSQTVPSALTAVLPAIPAAQRRFRGLALVSGARKSLNAAEKVHSFDQARRIVAQVEWEIEQQAARERMKHLRRWQPLSLAAAEVARPTRTVASASGISRLRRFFGL